MSEENMATARERDVAGAVAAELRAIMARQQVRALHLSRQAGIPNATLSTVLSGKRAIDVDQLARICGPLGVEPGDVLAAALAAIGKTATPSPVQPTDAAAQILAMLADPTRDEWLVSHLDDLTRESGVNGEALTRLLDTARTVRAQQLRAALRSLSSGDDESAAQ